MAGFVGVEAGSPDVVGFTGDKGTDASVIGTKEAGVAFTGDSDAASGVNRAAATEAGLVGDAGVGAKGTVDTFTGDALPGT